MVNLHNNIKRQIQMPDWLVDIIYNKYDATYQPDYQRYAYNLDLNEQELKNYLGTYFPRSFVETYSIFSNILDNKNYYNIINNKHEINILGFGCGCGGDIIGLIVALYEHLDLNNITLNVKAYDGNKYALSLLEDLIRKVSSYIKVNINYNFEEKKIYDELDLNYIKENSNYDFITCNKMVCELINKDILNINSAYYYIAKILSNYLNNTGLLLLLDVTTKVRDEIYIPFLILKNIKQLVTNINDLSILLPHCCGMYNNCDSKDCFLQQEFLVSHYNKINDISKVVYFVICKSKLKNEIVINDITNIDYYFDKCQVSCKHNKGLREYRDAYSL